MAAYKSSSVPSLNNGAKFLIGSSGKCSLSHLFDTRHSYAPVSKKIERGTRLIEPGPNIFYPLGLRLLHAPVGSSDLYTFIILQIS